MTKESMNRRQFLAGSAGTVATVPITAAAYARAVGANDRIGVGVIGCGGRGSHHISVVTKLKEQGEQVDMVAVSDMYGPRLRKAAERCGGKPFMDHRELLEHPAVDAVAIATPDHWHGHQVIDAVRAGKDVYCEKPITHWSQFELTKQMTQEVEKSQQVLQVGTQGMSDSVWHQAADLVKKGEIGKPIHVQCGYFRIGDWGERMPIDEPDAKPGDDLLWERFLGDAPKRSYSVSRFFQWRLYWDYAGGPSTDLFPHTFTPILKILGVTFPSLVTASGGKFRYDGLREVPDTFSTLIDYPEGISVAMLCTLGNDYGIRTIIRGHEATLAFDDQGIVLTPQPGVDREKKVIPRERKGSDYDFWRDFLNCCRTRQKPLSDIRMGYYVQTALQMGLLGFREGRVARFDGEREAIVL